MRRIQTHMLSVVSAGAAAGMGGMDRLRGGGRAAARELAATRDRQVRLHAVTTDLSLNLPPSIALPDGEEYHYHHRHHHHHRTAYSSRSRFHMRTPEQEAEIYQKCVRPPPNRSARESKSPPPYRSSSAGVLASSSSSSGASSDWSSSSGSDPMVVRCHSMSSTSSAMSCKPEVSGTSHHHSVSSQSAQKTDFLQRTVKIFTGKKSPATSSSQPMAAAPCVIVPTAAAQNRAQPRRDAGPGQKPPV
ncbi:trinucleotide repeat-containing gene 18 protein isoform X2 [Dendroctonus ponderosae]|uniref:Uncharacterized protein n=1 Tax=Dendroctonus ponderosae TaxID=77166 RepID=A0AAR5PNP3_DENPD|nr:trinucleotide repeat-containing gene 18 protein isoform X2 [Dendroctonus ponderosae]